MTSCHPRNPSSHLTQDDLSKLRQVEVVYFEDFIANPQRMLDDICKKLDLPLMMVPTDLVQSDVNDKYMKAWRKDSEEVIWALSAHELEQQPRMLTVDEFCL